MSFRLSNALAALGVAFIMVTAGGCSSDDCGDVTCSTGEVCEAGQCVAEKNLCTDVTCPAGTGCNLENGNCVNLCSLPGAPTCTGSETCDPTTGRCADLCAGVVCDSETLACNPASGNCERKCKPGMCSAEYQCVPTTGECIKHCETPFKPTGKDECAAGLKCQATSGDCVPLCEGVTCAPAQWCEPDLVANKGKCVDGPPPAGFVGATCDSDADCEVSGTKCGGNFDFLGLIMSNEPLAFENGYCTKDCQSDFECPGGSICLIGECMDACASNSDCRSDSQCVPLGGNLSPICLPTSVCEGDKCAPVGGDCAVDADCVTGAECIPEMREIQNPEATSIDKLWTGEFEFTGFEGGYCIQQVAKAEDCLEGTVAYGNPGAVTCFAKCTEELGVSACRLGEACQLVTSRATDLACVPGCSSNDDCNWTRCDPTREDGMAGCGSGQECHATGSRAGMCSTRNKCQNGSCRDGSVCDENNECLAQFCDVASAVCLNDWDCRDASDKMTSDFEAIGLGCNEATGHFERPCRVEDGVDSCGGVNAWCDTDANTCVAICTVNNESEVCGGDEICHLATGKCGEKCMDDAQCGDGVCGAGGRCLASCNAEVNPTICSASQACGSDGKCKARCTKSNETVVCKDSAAPYCHLSTGLCVPSCHNDPDICGETEACSVDGAAGSEKGLCAKTCASDANCGTAPTGESLSCLGPAGSKTCQFAPCDENTSSEACGAELECVAGRCRTPAPEPEPACTIATQGADCSPEAPYCDEDEDQCSATCSANEQCGESAACDEGVCVAVCTVETQGQVCPEGQPYCDGDTQRCQATCTVSEQCSDNDVCDGAGDCVERCTIETQSEICGAGYCNETSGLCETTCSINEQCSEKEECDQDENKCVPIACTLQNQAFICEDEFCNETTGKCESTCTKSEQCNGSDVCDSAGACVAACTIGNQSEACSDSASPYCNTDTGLCQAACSENANCGENEQCSAGVCEPKPCQDQAADFCGDQACNPTSGACEPCGSELACSGDLVCDSGHCIASCAADEDPTICEGGVACDVDSGICGKSCESPSDCGTDENGQRLTCNEEGSRKVCGRAACTPETAEDDCVTGETCVEDFCQAG